MADEKMKRVQGACPMTGGDDSNSYAQNSIYQKGVIDAAKGTMSEGIKDKLDFKNPCFGNSTTFKIADLGCSTGPNTFFAVQNIIEAVDLKYHTQFQNSPPLEFQVFFNDITDNDFNTLFKTLPLNRKYFVAGVPGSFYKRLFPKSTVNFVHSSYALHWLSKVPEEIADSKSPAWNKGSIQCTGLSKEVAKAYLDQFKNDINNFLNVRAEEIVSGGLMVIIIASRPDGVHMSETHAGVAYDMLGSCLIDMATSGVISQEKVDSFNIPLYCSTPEELEEIIEKNGHFSIEKIENLSHPLTQQLPKLNTEVTKFIAKQIRAVFQGLVREHFGNEDIADKIFKYLTEKYAENFPIFFDKANHQNLDMFILLKRKIN